MRLTIIGQDLVGTLCDLRQRPVDIWQVVMPGRGQDQLALTIEKLDVEPFFERFDAVTNRARCYIQFQRGEFKTAAASDSCEEPQTLERW